LSFLLPTGVIARIPTPFAAESPNWLMTSLLFREHQVVVMVVVKVIVVAVQDFSSVAAVLDFD
jgi:hypothetical protein